MRKAAHKKVEHKAEPKAHHGAKKAHGHMKKAHAAAAKHVHHLEAAMSALGHHEAAEKKIVKKALHKKK